METLKNFFIGLFVVLLSAVIMGLVFMAWPLVIGFGSVVLSFLAAVLFVVMLFYVIVLVGHLVRRFLKKA
ncbi:MAG: hypothetical protein GF392_04740 [Candidatus Omnitrophica bacterium]|nr:hypothetical protein [Candidatus Omnitrophota bacterium]